VREEDGRFFLNAADYLFVSIQVAKAFPDLLESVILIELSKKWRPPSNLSPIETNDAAFLTSRTNLHHRRKAWYQVSLIASLIFALQLIGTSPFVNQKRASQPLNTCP
jgi:hypothetical protein